MDITINQALGGRILDVGGGGEGIISRAYGRAVLSIDNRREELDEAPDLCEKRLMDAAALEFSDGSFDHVTFFYSLMYMDRDTKEKAVSQAARVLRPGGSLHIWDAEIQTAWPEPFLAELDIQVGGARVHTTYGVAGEDMAQDGETLAALCRACGLSPAERREDGGHFYLAFVK